MSDGSNHLRPARRPLLKPIVPRPPGSRGGAPGRRRRFRCGTLEHNERPIAGWRCGLPSPHRPHCTPRGDERGSPRRWFPKVDAGGLPRFYDRSASGGASVPLDRGGAVPCPKLHGSIPVHAGPAPPAQTHRPTATRVQGRSSWPPEASSMWNLGTQRASDCRLALRAPLYHNAGTALPAVMREGVLGAGSRKRAPVVFHGSTREAPPAGPASRWTGVGRHRRLRKVDPSARNG